MRIPFEVEITDCEIRSAHKGLGHKDFISKAISKQQIDMTVAVCENSIVFVDEQGFTFNFDFDANVTAWMIAVRAFFCCGEKCPGGDTLVFGYDSTVKLKKSEYVKRERPNIQRIGDMIHMIIPCYKEGQIRVDIGKSDNIDANYWSVTCKTKD